MTTKDTSLAGKTALVTGGSGGIGSAVCRTLAARGAHVAVHAFRNATAADAVAAGIRQNGGLAFAVTGNASDPQGAEDIVRRTVAETGRIDILVNNAGTLSHRPLGTIRAADVHEQFGANVLAVVLMVEAALPHFPPEGGRIVNVSTNLVTTPLPGLALYSAAKAAVEALTHAFAKELGARRITINAVAPGATRTPMTEWLTDEIRAGIATSTPLGRMAEPQDIAEVVAFFASSAAGWVTGRTLLADGGLA